MTSKSSGDAAAMGTGTPATPLDLLGGQIRELRHQRGLTLVQLAAATELSHSFLSQVERGLAQLSMSSLFRIAQALGTTQDRLLSAASRGRDADADAVVVVRRDEGPTLPVASSGGARQLVGDPRAFYATEFVGFGRTFEDFFSHGGDEFVYVAAGCIEVELGDGRSFLLEAGDSIRYPGTLEHRWRAARRGATRALMIHTDIAGHPWLGEGT